MYCWLNLGLFSCFQAMIMSHKDSGNLFEQTEAILIWQRFWKKLNKVLFFNSGLQRTSQDRCKPWPFLGS